MRRAQSRRSLGVHQVRSHAALQTTSKARSTIGFRSHVLRPRSRDLSAYRGHGAQIQVWCSWAGYFRKQAPPISLAYGVPSFVRGCVDASCGAPLGWMRAYAHGHGCAFFGIWSVSGLGWAKLWAMSGGMRAGPEARPIVRRSAQLCALRLARWVASAFLLEPVASATTASQATCIRPYPHIWRCSSRVAYGTVARRMPRCRLS